MSTSKIFNIGADLHEPDVTMLVNKSFNEGVSITLPMLLRWASQTEEVVQFFTLFKMSGPEHIQIKTLTEKQTLQYNQQSFVWKEQSEAYVTPKLSLDPSKQFHAKTAADLIQNKRSLNYRLWMATALLPLMTYRHEAKTVTNFMKVPNELKVQLKWVYGIRTSDVHKALQYTVGCLAADSIGARDEYDRQTLQINEELIYFVASCVVLLNANTQRQRVYLGHKQEVIAATMSTQDGQIIASSELGLMPAIHVWNRKSLESIQVMSGRHLVGVHLLQFTHGDKFIVSCSLSTPAAVLIYDWANGDVIISTCIESPIKDLFLLQELNSLRADKSKQLPNSGIVVISEQQMTIFTIMGDSQFLRSDKDLVADGKHVGLPTCGLALIADYKNQYFQGLDTNLAGQKHLFLTGHQDGRVLLWKSDAFITVLTEYKEPVTCMSKCYEGLAICTQQGAIHFWDVYLARCTKTIQLQSLPFKLLSYQIVSVDYNQKRLLVLTSKGDAVEIGLTDVGNSNQNKVKAKRIDCVTKLTGPQKALTLLNQIEETVVVGGDEGLVISFDLTTHELIDVWVVGNQVTALAALSVEEGGLVMAAGCFNGNIVIKQDWEEVIPRVQSCGNRTINDLQFSKNGQLLAAASSDKHVYLFQSTDGEYVKLHSCKLDNGFPISISFSADSKKIALCSNLRKLLLLDLSTYMLQYRVEDLAQSFWQSWSGRYPVITKSTTSQTGLIPIAIGNQTNMVAAGDENGNVFVWKDTDSVRNNIGVNLAGHQSLIQRVKFSKDDKLVFSLGQSDEALMQWKVQGVEQQSEEPKKQLTDENLIQELDYCRVVGKPKPDHEDNGLLIRGCNNQALNRLGARMNFDPANQEEWKRPPTVMLQLDHVYGAQLCDRRASVLYIHFNAQTEKASHQEDSPSLSRVQQAIKRVQGQSFQREAAERNIEYDSVHSSCDKQVAYYAGRIAVVYSPSKQGQRFYQGHTNKISCIQKHPTKRLLATSEVCIQPKVHIWSAQTQEVVVVLQTSHLGGILHLQFSPDGEKIVTVGMDDCFSIQIFQWEQKRSLSFRNLGRLPVFCTRFLPFENQSLITGGQDHIAVWKLNGVQLICQNFYDLPFTIMCFDYLVFKVGNSLTTDTIFGTSKGQITNLSNKKHQVVVENAHTSAINCIKVSDHISNVLSILTGGEDGKIKVWTTTYQPLQTIDIRDQVPSVLKTLKDPRAYGVQSLEMYCCDYQEPRRLLIGIRCGEIVEAVLSNGDFDTHTTRRSSMLHASHLQRGVDFEFYSLVASHSSLQRSVNQKKISCVVNPNHPVLVSAGDDETLRIFDLEKQIQIYSKDLGTQATSLTYSPDGAYLAVGMVNGVVLILDGKIDRRIVDGFETDEFVHPSLEVLMTPKEARAAVVCIKYSFNGDFLAISYNNEYRPQDQDLDSDIGIREPSFVLIYVNRISGKNPGLKLSSKDIYVKLIKLVLPLGDFVSSVQLRKYLAVTSCDFSDCDGYLQLSVQKINHDCVVDLQSYSQAEDCVVIWDIVNNSMVQNFDALSNSKWPEWSMAPAINARFQGVQIHHDSNKELLFKELCYMSRVSRFSLLDAAVTGSQHGDLYLFRFNSLTIEKATVADFRYDLVQKKDMAATRSNAAHWSTVHCIENFQDKLILTSSVSDQCILQFKLEYEDRHWELDFNFVDQAQEDPFAEIQSKEKFEKQKREIWSQRQQISDINQAVYKKDNLNPACKLQLQSIIGRRAYDRRQNVKLDKNDRVTYQAGSIQVTLDDQMTRVTGTLQESAVNQSFLRPENAGLNSISPELSCFTLSKDLRLLFCATTELSANVYIWDVTTRIKLGQLHLPKVSVITNIKVSFDNHKVLICGISHEYYQVITMIDWTQGNKVHFTRQFSTSSPYKIRDIEFINGSTQSFVTAGIQHLSFWKVNGQNLEYQVGELTIRKELSNVGQGVLSTKPANNGKFGLSLITNEHQYLQFLKPNTNGNENIDDDFENLFVSFLNIVYIGETLITSGDDGYLYIWAKERLEHRTLAHEGSVFALHAGQMGLLVSGGIEGIVILWQLQAHVQQGMKSLKRLRVFNLRPPNMDAQTAVMLPEYNVQSVCLSGDRVIIGMRSGSIYEVKVAEGKAKTEQVKHWIKATDHEVLKSVVTDMVSSRVFSITQYGLFQAWDLKTFQIIYSKNFAKITQYLRSWRLSNKILVVFESEIIVLDSSPQSNQFDELTKYTLQTNQISFAALNHNEQILGVAQLSSASQPQVTLYSTDGGFMKLKQIFGFKSPIQFLDFSADNYYMSVEDTVGEVTLYEIETDRPIQTDAIDFQIEWLGDGLRTYERLKGVRHQYSTNNRMVHVKKLLGKPIVAITDEVGTIRLFNYPNVKGEPFYVCVADHLFKISDCQFTPDRLYFLSCCEFDRCIFKWKMVFDDKKIQALLADQQ